MKVNFKEQNNNARAFFDQNFEPVALLISKIRHALLTGEKISLDDVNLEGILDFNPDLTFMYISLFQSGNKSIRFGSKRVTLEQTLARCVEMLRKNKNFDSFDLADSNKCRIMVEYVIGKRPIPWQKIQQHKFNSLRFEIGIDGIEIKDDNSVSYYFMPTDAVVESHMGFRTALNSVIRKTPIGKMTNKISERIDLLKQKTNWEFYLINTRAFVSYKNECVPLYRGNVMYNEFSFDTLIDQFVRSADWLIKNLQDDGRFLYYYDCCNDTRIDHEHPERPLDNLYYNDLRHGGGVVTLIRAYSHTGDKKYLEAAKKALDFTVTTIKEHEVDGKKAYYIYYNQKCKLGGIGLALIAMMQYRLVSADKSHDDYIIGLIRHLLSRITPEGEFLGYYIHPSYQEGKPLINMSEQERMETFSFYYPGEALLALGLFANHFEYEDELKKEVVKKTATAMDWIVDVRPKKYAHLFTALPSDAWLMQAIEEWTENPGFIKENHLNFVFNDARVMIEKMYTRDNSPYIDYEGGYYYEYGDHYYPDGARSEGLIASYYLAQKTGHAELAQKILEACKKAAMCQFHLFNCEKANYSHKVPEKSLDSIRFKATRQWVRVDSIQHVACFFIRLYWTEFPIKISHF